MTDFLEAIVDTDGRFLRVELPIDVPDEKGTLANS
jgi:hypothetical protein